MTRVSGNWLTNPATQRVMTMLNTAGYQAYFVGGCVRNALLGTTVSDIDIATDALPDTVLELASASGLHAIPTGIEHGTITVVASGLAHEITTFRRDVATDGRRAVVAFSTDIFEDARRRDFTMNALYATTTGVVHDPLGTGIDDLGAQRVKFVGEADARIKEDYLRSLRFFRFNAWYGDPDQGVDADALSAIAANLDGLDTLSRERVGSEIRKILSAESPAPSVSVMAQTGVLRRVLPGADAQYLAPLVHLDGDDPVDPIRRLAVLGGQDVGDRLRLSKAEARRLELLRSEMATADTAAVLGYRHGEITAVDIELLRAVVFERPLPDGFRADITRGANAKFPVRAADLLQIVQGPALGQRLKQLEQRWIGSDFQLTKSQLLG